MAEMLLNPAIEDSVSLTTPTNTTLDLKIDELSLKIIEAYHGIMIKDSKMREDNGLIIIGIIDRKGSNSINPDPNTILNRSDTILVTGNKEDLNRFKKELI